MHTTTLDSQIVNLLKSDCAFRCEANHFNEHGPNVKSHLDIDIF